MQGECESYRKDRFRLALKGRPLWGGSVFCDPGSQVFQNSCLNSAASRVEFGKSDHIVQISALGEVLVQSRSSQAELKLPAGTCVLRPREALKCSSWNMCPVELMANEEPGGGREGDSFLARAFLLGAALNILVSKELKAISLSERVACCSLLVL